MIRIAGNMEAAQNSGKRTSFGVLGNVKLKMGILERVQQSMTFTLSNLHFTKNQILQKKSWQKKKQMIL